LNECIDDDQCKTEPMDPEGPISSYCTRNVCLKLQRMLSVWLRTFVIKQKSSEDWQFRTLFVAEITILPLIILFLVVSWWAVNRNVRMKKTKGSSIPHKQDWFEDFYGDGEYEDEDEDDYEHLTKTDDRESNTQRSRKRRTRSSSVKRQEIQALLKAYTVEIDEDEFDNETILSGGSYMEESDYEDDTHHSKIRKSPIKAEQITTQMFLSKEKIRFWKVLREIPNFTFFNEEAMEMCLNEVEHVELSTNGDFLWKEGCFDGSLYYVVKGRVRVNFLDFRAPFTMGRGPGGGTESSASVLHEPDTVVTSQLALMEGMVRYYLHERNNLLDQYLGQAMKRTTAQVVTDQTCLLRIPSSCFSKILDRYPETVLRIMQTTLNRTQRVTVQTLIRCCGLRQELLVPNNMELQQSMSANKSSYWKALQKELPKYREHSKEDFDKLSDQEKHSLMTNACGTLASVLGIRELGTIQALEENCSLVTWSGNGDESDRILMEAGSKNDSCYLLLQGAMEMGIHLPLGESSSEQLQNDASAWRFQRIEVISPGSILGVSALFTTDVNLFEIRYAPASENCDDPAVLLEIPKNVYTNLVVKYPQAMATLLVPILSVLSPIVHLLTWTTEWMHVEAAGGIVKKGTPCNSLFVVLNGRLRAANRLKAHHMALGLASSQMMPPQEYGRGKIFGQVGSLANTNWPFDVFAIRQSELAKIPIKTIEIVVQNFPRAGLSLAREVASDVGSSYFSKHAFAGNMPGMVTSRETGKIGTSITKPAPFNLPSYGLNLATVAVVPLSYNIDLKRFCKTLCEAMETIAPCKVVTKSYVKQELGEKVYQNRDAFHDVKMTRLLADLEENNRVVIYQADPKFTFWTRLCVLQADCILLVVDSQQAPEATKLEQTLSWAYEAMDVRIELVVVGKGEGKVNGDCETHSDISCSDEDNVSVSDQLNNWSESRKWIAGHHLVRAPFGRHRIDFQRMCRRISGRSIGLVLGAGGARGIAHLGVIRALKEAGVTVDIVGGTSQGAFCGALFARYPDDYDQVLSACKVMAMDASSMKEKLLDLTLPMASIFGGKRFNRGIKKLLGKLRIQDLVLNFFCVSVDLQNQSTVVHTKGQLWKQVRCSMGLAGYLPPIAENGSLLVDGGYLNSLPADVMKYQMGARSVIAVDVSTECKREYFEYGAHLSGWWLLWNSWNPFVKTVQVPSMGDIQDMLIWVSSEQHRKSVKNVCDLHLTPPIQDVGTLEYDRFDEIVEKSYIYAKPIVDEWVRKNPWLVSSQREVKSDLDAS